MERSPDLSIALLRSSSTHSGDLTYSHGCDHLLCAASSQIYDPALASRFSISVAFLTALWMFSLGFSTHITQWAWKQALLSPLEPALPSDLTVYINISQMDQYILLFFFHFHCFPSGCRPSYLSASLLVPCVTLILYTDADRSSV